MTKRTPPKELLEKIAEAFQQKEAKRRAFTERYGHIKPPNVIRCFDNKTASVLEGGIYFQTRDTTYYFTNVIHDHALIFLGDQFLEQEEAGPFEERHPVMQWMQMTCDDDAAKQKQDPVDRLDRRRGVGMAWFRFAYDLYTIRDNTKLEAILKKRLMNREKFQAARHELRVAAICIAAGFNIDFEDETDVNTSHPEFIASDRFSSTKIAVEAKSQHRNGVLGFKGGKDIVIGSEVGAKNIVLKAYKKEVSLPFYVFVDVNLPPSETEEQFQSWLKEIYNTMITLAHDGYANPCPANTVFFCNDPSHFIIDRPVWTAGVFLDFFRLSKSPA